MSEPKKHVSFSQLNLQRLENGILKIKSKLEGTKVITDFTIYKVLNNLRIKFELLHLSKRCVTVEFPLKNKWMILKDKKLISKPYILTMKLFPILVQVLIGRGKDCFPFWNNQTMELSKKLLLPIEIGLQDSVTNCYTGSWKTMEQKSWFSMNHYLKTKNLETISCPLFIYTIVEQWENENTLTTKWEEIKSIRIKIKPDTYQKKVFKKWMGTYRFVYNKVLNEVENNNEPKNAWKLRNKFIPKKKQSKNEEWTLKTPKAIRTGAIEELVTNYKSSFSNLKNGNINHFKMKKKKENQCITLPKSSFSIENNELFCYNRTIKKPIKYNKKELKNYKIEKDGIKLITSDFDHYHLCIPVSCEKKISPKTKAISSLDPGIKTFQTYFDTNGTTLKFQNGKEVKLLQLIYKYNSIYSKVNKSLKLRIRKKLINLRKKHKFLIDELHWKTITFIRKNSDSVLLPTFETSKLIKKVFKRFRHNMSSLRHFEFQNRLIFKMNEYNKKVKLVSESFTSKTCTNCGWINKQLKFNRMFNCNECKLTIDRDVNGARNVLLKEMGKLHVLKNKV